MTSLQDKSRGAALIVAILVLAILLIIVLSFFQASRQEVSIATNYRNATQADLLAEGGTAIAIAFLNHDRTVHPTVTSIDHAWKTYFNGAWAAGKPWLWKYGAIINTVKGEGNAVPEYDLDWWTATRGDSLGDALYIPRVDGTGVYSDIYNPIANPFVVNYPSGPSGMVAGGITGDAILAGNNLGPLQVDRFADWDNDEDGLRDSAWIPMPMDVFPDMPADEPGDGIDNDLDGVIDESNNGLDDDGDGIIDNEPAERALFVYWGGNDGLDNDGNGQIDEVAERKPFLTTPFPPLDLNGDGIFDVTTYPSISVQARNPETGTVQSYLLDPNRGSADVDRLDNDYNLVINDTAGIAYTLINANDPTLSPEEKANAEDINRRRQATGFHAVDANTYFPGLVPPGTVVTFSGEPVCELVGRAAILVKDENSKVNMNAAGGRNFRDLPAPDITNDEGALRRALGSGASTAEYETRVLPQIENATSDRAWNQRTGGFSGIGMKSIGGYTANVVPAPATYGLAALNFDVSLPGFGRVDDNGNALWMAMDGIDNDGDGQIDEGLRGFGGAAEEAWAFEGVDEPQEYQTYRPLRNRDPEPDPVLGPRAVFAESDGIDNSASVADDEIPDGSVDEIGELGDRYLRSTEQLKLLQEYAGANFDRVRNLVTVNGTDLNSRFQRYFPDGFLRPAPALSGPKLDYNYATTEQIFNAIFHDWGYLPQVPVPGTPGAMLRLPLSDQDPGNAVGRFAVGLRREDTAIYAPNGILGGAVASAAGSVFPAFGPDPLLRAAQLATNIRDNRDRNLGRSEVATSIEDNWFKALQGAPATDAPRQIQYAQAGFESIRINEIMARAVRRVEAEMDPGVNFLNPNAFSDPAGIPDFEMEVLEPDSATPEWTRVGSVLGERSYFRSILEEDDTSSTGIDESRQKIINVGGTPRLVPKMIEFRFAASPGLPSFQPPATGAADEEYMEGARYYLMLNTARINPDTLRLEPTVSSETRLKYVIKYGRDGEGIIDDLTDPNTPPGFNPFVLAGDSPIVGYRPNGAPTGFVFLSGTESPSMDQAPVIDPAVPPVGFYNADEAYTVHIPPYRPADQVYLYVGIWFGDDDPETLDAVTGQPELALNFFDFSQEPDHEWIEIVNTATTGAPVNIEGWQLQVGADVMLREDGNSAAPALLTVPGDPDNPLDGDVLIAPGGSLLLGFNKYDPGTGRFNDPTLFGDVWLSKGSSSNLSDVSAIYRNGIALARGTYGNAVGTTVTGQLTTEPPIPGLDWATGNTREDGVFYRPTGDDFVDRNGDGIPEAGTPDDAVASTPDPDPLLSGVGTKHFDRIVELESVDIDAATSEDSIARLVLNGGIFPNYPEHDGIDNDGDNAILSNDGIDNDGDGLVDERDATEDLYDARPEGIDEGRWEYDADAEAANPLLYLRALNAPGSYGAEYLPYIFDNVATGTVDSTTVGNEGYTGSPTDPPEWKAFSERRWYTPDNVVVTLYAGPRAEGRVADRVTYSERDVINRAADDIRDATPFDRDDLNLPRPSFWPDNTMGVDFYRSIERKHPFYNGDLHGSSNRWQATDGSYDDWSPSTSMYIRSNVDGTEGQRFSDAAFNHAFSGSPLRMNLAQRYLETAIKLWAFEEAREGIRNRNYASPGDVANLVSFMDSRTPLAPADYANLNVPFDDVPINYAAPEDDSVQGVMLAQHPYDNMDNAVPPRNLADDDTAAVMSNAAMDPLILSVGTANFYSILPGPTNWPAWDGTAAAAPAAWAPVFLFPLDGDNVGNIALDPNSGVRYAQDVTSPYYLFTGPYSGAYPVNASFPEELRTQLGPRWPLQLRSVMYVSQNVPSPPANPGGFNPAGPHDFTNPAATALFEWDGGDGLENGDYDVYIMTADNLAPVRSADIASRTVAGDETTGRYLQPFGRELVNEAVDASSQDMAFDVEMFTDRNYTGAAGEPYGPNGRCWIDDPSGSRPNYPEIDPATGLNEFERIGVNAYNPQGDSFGMLPKRPDDDGIIYYGTIRVENNYLALLLRNWTANGKLARFSRVVLTPKPRTHGRLNINTVETALANFGATSGDHPFNPLIGTAGIFSHPDGTYIAEGSSIGPSVAEYANAGLISNKVVANRMRINTDLTNPLVRYHQDGRYYENPSDLLTPHVEEGYPDILTLLAPPLDPAAVFAETTGRYSRLANLITTRSDVFEITVTAQTGYLSSEDLNDDGRIDYRNDFIVTGEKKIRTVYER